MLSGNFSGLAPSRCFGAAPGDLWGDYQFHSEFGGFSPQCQQLSFGSFALKVSSTTIDIRFALGEQPIDQACQIALILARHEGASPRTRAGRSPLRAGC